MINLRQLEIIIVFFISFLFAGCANDPSTLQNVAEEKQINSEVQNEQNKPKPITEEANNKIEHELWFPRPHGIHAPTGKGHVTDSTSIDSNTGWAVLYTEDNKFNLYYTKDGGTLWNKSEAHIPIDALHVSFLDENIGWILGEYVQDGKPQAKILQTQDGGTTWSDQELPPPVELDKITEEVSMYTRKLWFFNESVGALILQVDHFDAKSQYIYFTSDKGSTWSKPHQAGIMSGEKPAGTFGSLEWDLSNRGEFIFIMNNKKWTSGDGGFSWKMEEL